MIEYRLYLISSIHVPLAVGIKCFKVLTHLTTPRRFFLSVNNKTSKKSMAHRGETARFVMLFFEVIPFTDKKLPIVGTR